MDQKYFMDLSGFDFLLIGILIGSFFHTFTTISLVTIFLITTNKKIAGIETWTYLHYAYSFVNRFFSSTFTLKKPEAQNKEPLKPEEPKKRRKKTVSPPSEPSTLPSTLPLTLPISTESTENILS